MDKPQPTRYLRSHKKQTDKIEVEANEGTFQKLFRVKLVA